MINHILTQQPPIPTMPENAETYESITQAACMLGATFAKGTDHADHLFRGTYDITVKTKPGRRDVYGCYGWTVKVYPFGQAQVRETDEDKSLCTFTSSAETGQTRHDFIPNASAQLDGILTALLAVLSQEGMAA